MTITPSPDDITLIEDCIDYRCSAESVQKTYLGFSTQMSEAINRSYRRSVARNSLYQRNAVARASATVHRLNNGIADGLVAELKAVGVPLSTSKRMMRYLQKSRQSERYDKWRQKTPKYKARRVELRAMRHELYYNRDLDKAKEISYAKALNEPID